MKSQYLSLFSVDSSAASSPALSESSDENSTAGEPENFSGDVASYSARYQAFLYQQSLRNQRANRQGSLDVLTSLGRGLLNLMLFVLFFFGFLTLFGFGLSRLKGDLNIVRSNVLAASAQDGTPDVKPSQSPVPGKKRTNNK